jgi:hypothetical protein
MEKVQLRRDVFRFDCSIRLNGTLFAEHLTNRNKNAGIIVVTHSVGTLCESLSIRILFVRKLVLTISIRRDVVTWTGCSCTGMGVSYQSK